MKGIVYRDADEAIWQALLNLQARMRDYVAVLGLELLLDEADTKYGEPKCEQWEVVVPELVFSPHN